MALLGSGGSIRSPQKQELGLTPMLWGRYPRLVRRSRLRYDSGIDGGEASGFARWCGLRAASRSASAGRESLAGRHLLHVRELFV